MKTDVEVVTFGTFSPPYVVQMGSRTFCLLDTVSKSKSQELNQSPYRPTYRQTGRFTVY